MTENEWKTYRTRFLIKAKQLNSNLSFTDALGRQHCGRKGDYLVESFEGVLSIAPRQIFEDIYVTMNAGDQLPAEPSNTPTLSLPDLRPETSTSTPVEAFDLNRLAPANFPRRRRSDRPPAAGARRKSPQPVRTPRVTSQLGLM
jgi:hypothetical protein